MSDMATMIRSTRTCEVIENEPMSRHTSWRAGGCARHYAIPRTLEQLQQLMISLPVSEKIEWMGLGSNTLVRDAGFNGTIVATQHMMSEIKQLDRQTLYVGAGVADAKLARFCTQQGMYEAAFFAGIPGLFGGALAMNAGAWGEETWAHVISVETMNRKGEVQQRRRDEFEIAYRQVSRPCGEWFVSAIMHFNVSEADQNRINSKQLLAKRAQLQPTGVASCGSVFRNPEGDHAARLIEQCGLKGTRSGGAIVSGKHANFIINDNNASADDIESLIKLIQQSVKQQQGVLLQPEVKIIGEKTGE